MRYRLLASLGLVLVGAAPTLSHAAGASALEQFRRAHLALAPHVASDGIGIDNSPAAIDALRAQWAAARAVALDALNRRPAGTPAALARYAKPAGLALDATPLDRDTFLVSAGSGAFATVFLLHRPANGSYRAALAFDNLPPATLRTHSALAAWSPASIGSKCQSGPGAEAWSRCGPQGLVRVIPLSKETTGARRFAVIGDYVTSAGGTEAYQLSIWRWDGRAATPLLVRTMTQSIEEPLIVRTDKSGFTLRRRDEFEGFGCGGPCVGRQMELRFDMPPVGATPPRVRSLDPDVDLVDQVFARLSAHQPTADLAAPAVVAHIKDLDVGGVGPWRMLGTGRTGRRLCLDAIGFDRPRIFHIATRAGRPWIAQVTVAQPHACDGRGSKP
ncbi:hypothetical protein ACSBM8_00750 [Sphingomonas sp. ASY06-1R]|uniref:hypothetical protein n=1 Tax=Sphingomonas sp. ASY06-1R TaxID=3445771 RepID=UPI003FA28CBB